MIGNGESAEIYFGERDGGGLAFLGVFHVNAIGGQGKLVKGAGKAGIWLDDGEERAGGDVDAGEGAAEHTEDFADKPIVLVSEKKVIGGEDGFWIPRSFEEPKTEIEFAGAQGENSVVELASHLQRLPFSTGGEGFFYVFGCGIGGADGDGGGASFAIVLNVDKFVVKTGIVGCAFERRENYAFCVCGAIALLGELAGALLDVLGKLLRLHDFVNEAPVFGALAAYAVRIGAEDVGMIAADVAFVRDPRKAAGAGENAEKRKLREADGGGAVVDEDDFVAGEGKFVAAAGGGAIERGEEFEAGVRAGVFDAVARFVCKFAEVDFPGVRGKPKHIDVGAGTENAILGAGDDDGADFRMLEADALQRVMQLDIDAEVVGVELELVTGTDAAVFRDVHGERGDGTVESEAPMLVAGGIGLEIDRVNFWLKLLCGCVVHEIPPTARLG